MLSFCDTLITNQKNELLEHGIPEFPIACYYDNLKRKLNPWHWHEEFEVGIVRESSVIIKTPDKQIQLKKGDCFFINSSILHTIQNIGSGEGLVDSLVFHGKLLGGNVDSVFWNKYILPIQTNPNLSLISFDNAQHKNITSLISSAWMECVKNDFGFEINVRFLLTKLFSIIKQENPQAILGKRKTDTVNITRVKAMLEYIRTHYSEDLTLNDIANSASISKSECIRCFHIVLKTSPIAYLNKYRLQCAAGLLNSTQWKISYICQQCGFHNISYFSKSFKKVYGCTPSSYKSSSNISF